MLTGRAGLVKTAGYHCKRVFLNTVVSHFALPKRWRNVFMRAAGIPVGKRTIIYSGLRLRSLAVRIGNDVVMNYDCKIIGNGMLTIEDNVMIGPGTVVITESHEIATSGARRTGPSILTPVTLHRGSWLGANVTVLPGCDIAEGCVIATGATVVGPTLPDGIYAGVPARRIRDLDPLDPLPTGFSP